MKPAFITTLLTSLLLASAARAAEWPKQRFVQIHDEPQSALCMSTARVVRTLAKRTIDGRLYREFRDPRTRAATDVQADGLTFHATKTGQFATVDRHGVKRTRTEAYYLIDIDNNGSKDMITLVSGGHGPAGEGDTLYVLEKDLSSAPQPVSSEALGKAAVEIGGWTTSLYGEHLDFDPAYFIFPFSFEGKSYLLLEGNRAPIKYVVAELVPGTGLVTHCYF